MSRSLASYCSSMFVILIAGGAWAQPAIPPAPSQAGPASAGASEVPAGDAGAEVNLRAEAPPAPSYTAPAPSSATSVGTPAANTSATSATSSETAPATAANAAPPSLMGKKVHFSGYGGVDVLYTRMFGRDGAVVGLQGALLLDHKLALGIAGYGWTNPERGPSTDEGVSRRYQTVYGGFTAHYSFYWDSPAYLTVGALFGGGAVALTPTHSSRHDDDYERDHRVSDTFVVLQPDVTMHLNLTPWLRAGVTAGYRITSGVGYFGFQETDVNGLVVGASLQAGNF
ncbi:MAG TPA: hypothetical protein VFQ61_19845 [Polyangiaceae bacterium]|nr:hypothetical protein [Polyangiaceae bacterium]